MGSTVTASDGTALPLDSLAVAITWDGSFVATLTVNYPNLAGVPTNYVQTFTNNGTDITNVSQWVAS